MLMLVHLVAFSYLLTLAGGTEGLRCVIGQERDPTSPGKYRWVIPVEDPCQCTKVRLGGLNKATPKRDFNVTYYDTPFRSSDPIEIRQLLNCSDPCLSTPCQNNGTCNVEWPNYECDCLPNYEGQQCQDYNPCLSNPCLNEGTCDKVGHGYMCSCMPLYYGVHCENEHLCFFSPCQNGGTCVPTDEHHFSCKCTSGYVGTLCEHEDPCVPDPCEFNGTCVIKLESASVGYFCNCTSGRYGPQCTKDDPCLSDPCTNDGICSTSPTTSDPYVKYSCDCPADFYGPLCADSDPCLSNPCSNSGSCQVFDGDTGVEYWCYCTTGFYGHTCTVPDPCTSNPCSSGSSCVTNNKGTRYSCNCPDGLIGSDCSKYDPCSGTPNHCLNGGTCSATVQGSGVVLSCECLSGFYGDICEIPDPCEPNPCRNGGACETRKTASGVEYDCECASHYFGTNCGVNGYCLMNPSSCQNEGTCRSTYDEDSGNHGYTCTCLLPYFGPNCEILGICFRYSSPCLNGGACTSGNSADEYTCDCTTNYFGTNCDLIGLCESPINPPSCQNGGTCESTYPNGMLGYKCLCVPDYYGEHCENPSPCLSALCLNGGSCSPSAWPSTQFTCHCEPGFFGPTCAIGDDTALASCSAYLGSPLFYGSNFYKIKPDCGGAPTGAITVYCDHDTDGGGWMRLFSIPPDCSSLRQWTSQIISCIGSQSDGIAITDGSDARSPWIQSTDLTGNIAIDQPDVIANLANCKTPTGDDWQDIQQSGHVLFQGELSSSNQWAEQCGPTGNFRITVIFDEQTSPGIKATYTMKCNDDTTIQQCQKPQNHSHTAISQGTFKTDWSEVQEIWIKN